MIEVTHKDALTFRLDGDNKLLAVYEPDGDKVTLDATAVREILARQNQSDLFLDEKALSRLVQTYNNSNAGFILEIGERRDGEFIIKVSDDKMTAWLTMTPAYGGAPVTFDQLRRSLKEKGIVTSAEIEAVLKEGKATDYIIAQGTPAVPGLDAQFHSLVPAMQERRPQINEHGIADFRNLGSLILVKQGDPLMRRPPPNRRKKRAKHPGANTYPKAQQKYAFYLGTKRLHV